jgi:uncharacterized membrane protein (DUF485 family)
MAGHGPAVKLGKDNASPAKAKLGLILFFFYAAFYAGFVIINVNNPQLMGKPFALGLNLAVFYGFSLILIAIVLGVVYNFFCTRLENKLNKKAEH